MYIMRHTPRDADTSSKPCTGGSTPGGVTGSLLAILLTLAVAFGVSLASELAHPGPLNESTFLQ